MIRRMLISALLAVTPCAAAPQAGANDAQPAPIPGLPPKGRVIIDGAMTSKAGPPAYAIAYVADGAVAGTPLCAVLKCLVKVEKLVKNPKTGQEEKKTLVEPVLKTVPMTLKKQGDAAARAWPAATGPPTRSSEICSAAALGALPSEKSA